MKAYLKLLSVLGTALALLAWPLKADFVYVANFGSNNVSAYLVGPNGALIPVAGSPFPTGLMPGAMVVDTLRRLAYVGNWSSFNISGYSIGENGVLTPTSPMPAPRASR